MYISKVFQRVNVSVKTFYIPCDTSKFTWVAVSLGLGSLVLQGYWGHLNLGVIQVSGLLGSRVTGLVDHFASVQGFL